MKKQKKLQSKILIFTAVITGVLLAFLFFFRPTDRFLAALQFPFLPEKQGMIVAACPTFYYLLDELQETGVEVIKTNSAAEILYYLQKNGADLIIAGRMFKPGEPQFSFEVVGPGYSFLADKEFAIQEREMVNYLFFTDLSAEEITGRFPHIIEEKILETDDVYAYLDQGIVITSVENTDYSISEIVHVFRGDGSRHRFSRAPVIYYKEYPGAEFLSAIKE